MITTELKVEIRRLFFAEHWKIGTIAAMLGLHAETVKAAIEWERFGSSKIARAKLTDPYIPFIEKTLESYPRLRATRIHQMLVERGYTGSVAQVRRAVAGLRPRKREAFLCLKVFPGEEAQADWACFGKVRIKDAERRLSCFVLTLSYSRALYLEFFFDQTLENFLLGFVHAFKNWHGVPRNIKIDNLKSAVLERRGDGVRFHERFLELSAHYHFAARPCAPGRGNEKGRVERTIQYIRHSFFAARPFTTLADFNRQALEWRDRVAHERPWPGGASKTVAEVLEEERPRLLDLPAHPFDTGVIHPAHTNKTIYVRFDLNDYSIPPEAVGRQLMIAASPETVRILDGQVEIARHKRSYGRREQISNPAHIDAVLKEKRKAIGSVAGTRLEHASPEINRFLDLAFQRGESILRLTPKLLRLLDDFGPEEFRAAVTEAIQNNTPNVSSISFIVNRRHRAAGRRALMRVTLPRRPELEDLSVSSHQLEDYDELAQDTSSEQ